MSGKRLYHKIANEITKMIDDGIFPPGSRLPGERELAERFNVSRVTIREAEIALQAIGRIEIKTGSGVYVSEREPEATGQLPQVSAFELTEARSLIESEAAALAARNISPKDLEELRGLIKEMSSSDQERFTRADQKFHMRIAMASNNGAMIHAIQNLWRMRRELPRVQRTYESVCSRDTALRVKEHEAIMAALEAHDPDAARSAMRAHFYRLTASMLDAMEKQALRDVQLQAEESRKRFLSVAN